MNIAIVMQVFLRSHSATSLRGVTFFSLKIIIMLHNNARLQGAPPMLCCTSLGGCDDLVKVCGYSRGDFYAWVVNLNYEQRVITTHA
jgi:hypothetical protein